MSSYGTATTISSGLTLTSGSAQSPQATPKALIATRAVQVKDGWVGQVIVAEAILWETIPREHSDTAEREATRYVIERIKGLLTADPMKKKEKRA